MTSISFFVITGAGALLGLIAEDVFHQDWSIQGSVVAVDRLLINASSLVFLAAIPTDRFEGDKVSGRQFTMYVGTIFMFLGVVFVASIKHKIRYHRKHLEAYTKLATSGENYKLQMLNQKTA